MEKKVILFDLDGTLTDSGEGIMNCAEMTLERFGLPVPPREDLRIFVGPPLTEVFGKFGVPADRVDEAVAIFRSRYIPVGIFENTPYDGIRELLEKLNAQGHKLFIATSKPESMAYKVLDHFDLTKYFAGICGATMDRSRQTKGEVIAYLLEQNGKADNMVMIGDTSFDMIGAAAHGIPGIGVSWGYGDVDKMKAAGARAIASTPEMLFDLINE